jgi:hypothetical protein
MREKYGSGVLKQMKAHLKTWLAYGMDNRMRKTK